MESRLPLSASWLALSIITHGKKMRSREIRPIGKTSNRTQRKWRAGYFSVEGVDLIPTAFVVRIGGFRYLKVNNGDTKPDASLYGCSKRQQGEQGDGERPLRRRIL
jgi:hypothetical protein